MSTKKGGIVDGNTVDEIKSEIQTLRDRITVIGQEERDLYKKIDVLELQLKKQQSQYIVILKTESGDETKYARDKVHAKDLLNLWLTNVKGHPGYTVDWFDDDNGFKYRYTSKDWMKIEREYRGTITIEVNSEYVAAG